jgi:hypothetical protein
VQDITYATNSQNPVDLRDLRSNDEIQRQLEIGMADLKYTYKRQREEGGISSSTITSATTAEAVLAIWKERPHQAKFRRNEHFGKLYDDIFKNLNAAQAIVAVTIFRAVENERKRPTSDQVPDYLPYASHYLAMLIGRSLLSKFKIKAAQINHRNFHELLQSLKSDHQTYHQQAVEAVNIALEKCYGSRKISLQQLAATFRRGDLLEMLQ